MNNRTKYEGKFGVAHRMADAVIEIAKVRDGVCEAADLVDMGFTRGEIKQHEKMASALSHVTVNLKKLPDA